MQTGFDSFSANRQPDRVAIRARGAFSLAPVRRGEGRVRGGRCRAFTLAEVLVVMVIMVLLIALVVPAFRALSGQRSVSAARNQVAAMIVRAREEAIGLQDYRGIFFYLDPATDRVVGTLVRAAPVRARTTMPGSVGARVAVWLDQVPDRDSLMLPVGIRLQTINGSVIFSGGTRASDGYDGFNIYNRQAISPPTPSRSNRAA